MPRGALSASRAFACKALAAALAGGGLWACASSSPAPASGPPPPGANAPIDAIEPLTSPAALAALLRTSTGAPSRVLATGDLVEIKVYQQSDLDLAVRIPGSGAINFPLIGEVPAAGVTPEALTRSITERLARDYLHDPHVSVTVREYAPRKVYILGGVERPGGYPLSPAERLSLLQLISAAGGFTDRANKERVQIVRRRTVEARDVLLISLREIERALARGRAEADLELLPDDLVVIPSGVRVVHVLGAVRSPGSFELPPDVRVTASMAISKAGSYTKYAATSRIQVLRQTPTGESQSLEVDLDRVVDGQLDSDVTLEPGDFVWVPERSIC